mgnify:CR=1 FL=1
MPVPTMQEMQTVAEKIVYEMSERNATLTRDQVDILCDVLHVHFNYKTEVIKIAEQEIDKVFDKQLMDQEENGRFLNGW